MNIYSLLFKIYQFLLLTLLSPVMALVFLLERCDKLAEYLQMAISVIIEYSGAFWLENKSLEYPLKQNAVRYQYKESAISEWKECCEGWYHAYGHLSYDRRIIDRKGKPLTSE